MKKLQRFQKHTRSDMCQYDLVFEIDKTKLLFLQRLVALPETMYFIKDISETAFSVHCLPQPYQVGFNPDVFSYLDIYGLRRYSYIVRQRSYQWKRSVQRAVRATANRLLSQKLNSDVEFSRFRNRHNT